MRRGGWEIIRLNYNTYNTCTEFRTEVWEAYEKSGIGADQCGLN